MKSALSYSNQSRPLYLTSYQVFHAREQTRERIFGIACYFGFAPLLWLLGIPKRRSGFLQHHFRHSLAFSLLVFLILFVLVVADILGYAYDMLLGLDPGNMDALRWLVNFFNYAVIAVVVTLCVTWLVFVVSAWRRRTPHLPLLSKLTRQDGWVNFSLGWTVLVQIGMVLLMLIAVHGNVLVSNPGPSPQAYILYTTGGYIPTEQFWASYTPPRWTMSLFFYPIVTTATSRWGRGSVMIEPLSDVTFKKAIRSGKFVFVASHGGLEDAGAFSYAYNPYRNFSPSDLQSGDAGPQLRYVYFAACYAGYLESEWRQALAPADVKTFARISYVEEHFVWVWTEGAKVIHSME